MERELVSGLKDAEGRLIREMLSSLKERLRSINNYTSFNAIRSFTPAEVEILVKHLDKCHSLLFDFAELNDYELPFRAPKLIYAARELKASVS